MKITADSVKAAEKVLADNGIEEDEAQSVLQAVGYALAGVELYPSPEYGALDWLADAAKARDAARDYVERIWARCFRKSEAECFCDYWVTNGKIRISTEYRRTPDDGCDGGWKEYPASIFESEAGAEERAEAWRKGEAKKALKEAALDGKEGEEPGGKAPAAGRKKKTRSKL